MTFVNRKAGIYIFARIFKASLDGDPVLRHLIGIYLSDEFFSFNVCICDAVRSVC